MPQAVLLNPGEGRTGGRKKRRFHRKAYAGWNSASSLIIYPAWTLCGWLTRIRDSAGCRRNQPDCHKRKAHPITAKWPIANREEGRKTRSDTRFRGVLVGRRTI